MIQGVERWKAGAEWFSVAETAAILGMSKFTIDNWRAQGRIEFNRFMGAIRISRTTIQGIIDKDHTPVLDLERKPPASLRVKKKSMATVA